MPGDRTKLLSITDEFKVTATNMKTGEVNADAIVKVVYKPETATIPRPTRKIKRSNLGVSHDLHTLSPDRSRSGSSSD
jgi:hypothetical protein